MIEKVHLATGKVQLDILGFAGETCVIQTSTNLIDWVTLATRAVGPDGEVTYEHINPPAGSMRFYRIIEP